MQTIDEYVDWEKENGYHVFAIVPEDNPKGLAGILGKLSFEIGREDKLKINIRHTSEIDFGYYGRPVDEGHIISTNRNSSGITQILLENGPFPLP